MFLAVGTRAKERLELPGQQRKIVLVDDLNSAGHVVARFPRSIAVVHCDHPNYAQIAPLLREHGIPVILMTRKVSEQAQVEMDALGAVEFVSALPTDKELDEAVARVMNFRGHLVQSAPVIDTHPIFWEIQLSQKM